jgi:hypothetical protein
VKNIKKDYDHIVSKAKASSGVGDLMKVYERFQDAYAKTEQYLELISPKTHQTNSNQSLVTESK